MYKILFQVLWVISAIFCGFGAGGCVGVVFRKIKFKTNLDLLGHLSCCLLFLFFGYSLYLYSSHKLDLLNDTCFNKIVVSQNSFIESSIDTMYKNNYHCDNSNYQADVLCKKLMVEINKENLEKCEFNNSTIDKLIRNKYSVN